jgi:hypothetical protein
MGWVRTHIRWGARLALIALSLQFALSFGHFHGIPSPNPAVGHIAAATVPLDPDNDRHSDGTSDVCAVCAVIAMAGTMLAAAPPALAAPLADRLDHRRTDPAFTERTLRFAFQPRGPPHA